MSRADLRLRRSGHLVAWPPLAAAILAGLACCVIPAAASAQPALETRHLVVGDRPDGALPTLRMNRAVILATRGAKTKFRVPDVPLATGEQVEIELERFEVTSPRTRFVLGRRGGDDITLAFDASQVALYRGRVVGRPGSRVVLALREGHHTGQIDLGPGEPRYWISSRGAAGQVLAPDRASIFQATANADLPPGVPICGNDPAFSSSDPGTAGFASTSALEASGGPFVGLHHLELAVETDYEFYALFGDAAEAAAYLVALYGQVSDIYQRDTDTHIELSFARIWDTPDDLFNEVDPSPLSAFRSYWQANMGFVQRDAAQLLSGRRDYPFGGQAYLSAMCGSLGYGVVGYAQGAFPDPTQPSPYSYDVSVTAHELGHNAGTGHTHDSPNFVDTCDDPVGVPQRGTIMSYCSQTWSGGNSNRDLYLHSRIQQNIDAHFAGSSCIVADCNLNGIADALDISATTSADVNLNAVPDECEDCNDNLVLDPDDILFATSSDVDGDGVPDECEPDCNTNGIPDDHDIFLGTSSDAYGNDVPDECETDCDGDSVSDYSEIQLDMTLDIDRNAQLDACQDCDNDGTPDLDALAGAHDLWLASGNPSAAIARFHASTGVLSASASGGGGALLDQAQDLIVTDDLRVLVTSAGDDRVAEFEVGGGYLGDLVASGTGGLDHPAGLTVSPAGELLVASHLTDEILRYDLQSGAFLGVFVTAGLGGLVRPHGLAFGPNGHLYVTSELNEVIEYDGNSGALVGPFVSATNNAGLSEPRGILFLPNGDLLVTSFATNQTLAYRKDSGAPLGRWAKSGNSTRLNQESPWGQRIGPNGNVFIVRTGEEHGSSGGGGQHESGTAPLHLTNAQIYEFDVRNGNFLRAHVNGNDHGFEFPTGFAFVPGWAADCNSSGVPDECDIASGASQDLDASNVPDECEIDCNLNGQLDRIDLIPYGDSTDCNANLIPDECDSSAGVPGACEVGTEGSCLDGFDNDRDGLWDCADADCLGTGACLGSVVAASTFDVDTELFGYLDDAFRGTSQPAYATGTSSNSLGFEGTGGLAVILGGVDNATILGMSGAWQRTFFLAAATQIQLQARYLLEQTHGYEIDEYSEVLVAINGSLIGTAGNDYVARITGDGQSGVGQPRTTGWQSLTLDLGLLAPGPHTLWIGGYNNQKTLSDEETTITFDDIALVTVQPAVCGDALVSPGEDCDDGGTLGGDCCSSGCQFEGAGSGCNDADACSESDACDGAGQCVGSPVLCDDGNVCTVAGCDPLSGCFFTPIPGCGAPLPTQSWPGFVLLVALLLAVGGVGAWRER